MKKMILLVLLFCGCNNTYNPNDSRNIAQGKTVPVYGTYNTSLMVITYNNKEYLICFINGEIIKLDEKELKAESTEK